MKKFLFLLITLAFFADISHAGDYLSLNQVQALINSNKNEDARAALQNIIQTSYDTSIKSKAYFMLCGITEKYEEAVAYCRAASDLEPFNANIFVKLARLHNMQRDYYSAEQAISKALRLNPNMADAYGVRGIIYQRMQRPQDALSDLNRALELDPSCANYVRRGQIFFEQLKQDAARQDFETAGNMNPPKPLQGLIAYYMAKLSYRKQDFDAAERFSRTAATYIQDNEKKLEAQSILKQIQSAKEWR